MVQTIAGQCSNVSCLQLIRVRSDLSRRETMCEGYESQLQRVQEQMVLEMDDKERMMDHLRAENVKYQVCDSLGVLTVAVDTLYCTWYHP